MKTLMLILMGMPVLAQEAPNPLDDALWKGTLTIKVGGDFQNQFLANTMDETGTPIGFQKDKASLELDLSISFEFLVNSLGETTFVLKDQFRASERIRSERKHLEQEEQVLEGGIKAPLQIQFIEVGHSQVEYAGGATYTESDNSLGSIKMTPKGNLKKRGELRIEGELNLRYTGKGLYKKDVERQPPSNEYARLMEEANLNKTLTLPVNFQTTVRLKKGQPVTGSVSVQCDLENPFAHPDVERGRDIPQNKVIASGSISLEPLFN